MESNRSSLKICSNLNDHKLNPELLNTHGNHKPNNLKQIHKKQRNESKHYTKEVLKSQGKTAREEQRRTTKATRKQLTKEQ